MRRENAACLTSSDDRVNRRRDSRRLNDDFALIGIQRIEVAWSEIQHDGGITLYPVSNVF